MDEHLFRATLIAERKRADRSNQALGLLVVALQDADAADSPALWAGVIVALEAVIRGVDVLGWFQSRKAIGVILPELRGPSVNSGDLEARVRRELSRRLPEDANGQLTIQFHLHDTNRPAHIARPNPVDLSLFPELQTDRKRHPIYDALKRALDIAGSLTLLLLLSPVFLIVALAVKATSPGPVIYRQPRIGRMMKPFTMLKFRSMHVNADAHAHVEFVSWFINGTGRDQPGKGGIFKLTNDRRITPIGRLLRGTSLDELPQFWNVLRGEMSLVGPRPPMPYEFEQYRPWHCRRVLEAKPGITGLWQVTGRSHTTFDEMVRLDLRYARTCSLWNDLKILAATPAAVLSGRGAC
jgi:lipopolysaccharide/colanic/teichoic acid biosynthesis glycosyltransferase